MTPYNEYMCNKAQVMLDGEWVHKTGIECTNELCPGEHYEEFDLRYSFEKPMEPCKVLVKKWRPSKLINNPEKNEKALCPRCLGGV